MKRPSLLLAAILAAFANPCPAICFDTTLKPARTAEQTVIEGATIIDLVTGLEWQRCALGATYRDDVNACAGTPRTLAWDEALREAVIFNGDAAASPQSWRIPDIKELESAEDPSCYRPVVNPSNYPDTPSDAFWSSTPDPRSVETRQAPLLYVNFEDGLSFNPGFTGRAYVRLVRSLRP